MNGLDQRAKDGEVLFGTMETWLIWNLTGGADGGLHITDVTNASRTMLMNIRALTWDEELLEFFGVPRPMLPEIRSSAEGYGDARSVLPGVRITAALGDQQAALFGQTCFTPGEAKCTYGTGSFLLLNTGTDLVRSRHGLLTTVAYKIGDQPPAYALEGSIAVTGSLVQWFRDRLGLINSAPEIETLARTVEDNGGCYIVPAFSGLFAPHWRSDARGVIVGLTSYITKGHLARAVLEATGWQTREVVDAMNADFRVALKELKVDGGMTADNLLMQFVADVLDVPVVRPMVAETVSSAPPTPRGLPPATGRTWKCCAATGTGPPSGCRTWTPSGGTWNTTTGSAPSSGRWGGSNRRGPGDSRATSTARRSARQWAAGNAAHRAARTRDVRVRAARCVRLEGVVTGGVVTRSRAGCGAGAPGPRSREPLRPRPARGSCRCRPDRR